MTRKETLEALIEKVEAGEGSDAVGYWAARVFNPGYAHAISAYNGSLDAAKALHDAVLPGWTLNSLHQSREPNNGMPPTGQWTCLLFRYSPTIEHVDTKENDPARAWLLAILRALLAQEASA